MADLSITAANVVPAATAVYRTRLAGATITAGQIVYLDPADNRFKLADADAAGVANIGQFYMALSSAANGQPLAGLVKGDVTMNAVLTAGVTYYLSPTAGGVAPRADVLTGDSVILLGTAKSTTVLAFAPQVPGVVSA